MLRNLWKYFLAWSRLDLNLVCEMSKGHNEFNDYHDYPDSTCIDPYTGKGQPWHFMTHVCKRCGKEFII